MSKIYWLFSLVILFFFPFSVVMLFIYNAKKWGFFFPLLLVHFQLFHMTNWFKILIYFLRMWNNNLDVKVIPQKYIQRDFTLPSSLLSGPHSFHATLIHHLWLNMLIHSCQSFSSSFIFFFHKRMGKCLCLINLSVLYDRESIRVFCTFLVALGNIP